MPLELTVTGFEVAHFGSRLVAMAKPTYAALSEHLAAMAAAPGAAEAGLAGGGRAVVYVPSTKQVR